ncbi:MAG TPA: acetyl-CoA carboxylase biotin carboxyl carrier protein [Candidatus Latescibacteria bacterium]|nr:acetyl-CoA carboxylase biotin carboxyl carrier protein [Candidatus Latescibacterota bacterium]HOS65658.1 acetyl-CoA carboxylase biotin carboxyl carrier protein [Candidatus Latescibacterota bacterium]HPK75558.1 acetyl-CoA carboxylase biotin carboxyl carrier protein [Candidatus Latescibacterota bacterium]
MTLDEIKRLIELVQESAVAELEYAHGEERIRIVREREAHPVSQAFPHIVAPAPVVRIPDSPPAAPAKETQAAPAAAKAPDANLLEIKAPMVGTFYRAPAPEAAPYIETGAHVAKGQIIGIIEAMKLMNEIPADVAGTVVEIAVENAEPVEFGQVLVRVKPD